MNSSPPRDTGGDRPEPIAWAVYGGKTGALRYVLQDEDRVLDLTESGYVARPLFEHPAPTPPAADAASGADQAWETYRFANWINEQREPYTEGIFRAGYAAAREARS